MTVTDLAHNFLQGYAITFSKSKRHWCCCDICALSTSDEPQSQWFHFKWALPFPNRSRFHWVSFVQHTIGSNNRPNWSKWKKKTRRKENKSTSSAAYLIDEQIFEFASRLHSRFCLSLSLLLQKTCLYIQLAIEILKIYHQIFPIKIKPLKLFLQYPTRIESKFYKSLLFQRNSYMYSVVR